jgi:predicted Kef-type K+ transport protein
VLSLFVLIGNPLIVLVLMSVMGYRKRTGFLAGLTVAQISEFSLIFMAMGVAHRPRRVPEAVGAGDAGGAGDDRSSRRT